MLSEALLDAAREVMRRSEAGNTPLHEQAERICLLLRVTALTSPEPSEAVDEIRRELRPFIPEGCILESITGRVLQILDSEDVSRETIEPLLNSLLEEVREAHNELIEQASSMLSAGDSILMLAEPEGGFLEAALRDAADAICDDPTSEGRPLRVTLVKVAPDHDGIAKSMHNRLRNVQGLETRMVRDADVTAALCNCSKVILTAIAMDVDDGGLCYAGSGIVCAAANRMKVPVVLVMARHRMVPVGNASVAILSQEVGCPGKVWCYEEARDDRKHEAISVQANVYDLVPLQKCEMVVTEHGGYSSEYVKTLAPNYEGAPGDLPR